MGLDYGFGHRDQLSSDLCLDRHLFIFRSILPMVQIGCGGIWFSDILGIITIDPDTLLASSILREVLPEEFQAL